MNRLTSATVVATALIAFLLLATPAQALSSGSLVPTSGQDCNGEVQVQTNPLHNRYDCEDCQGNIIVQVGTRNDVDCGGSECQGNVIVQAGADNTVDCATGLLHLKGSSTATMPCPSPAPAGNFFCHLAAEVLPQEVCLTFDYCLW